MFLRDLLSYFKSDKKVSIVSESGILFFYSLLDFFDCSIPCVKNLLSCKVKEIFIDEQGELKIYLFGYGKGI